MNPIPQKKFVKKFIPSSFELPNFEPTTSYTTRLQPFPPSFFQSHSSCLFRLVSFVQTRSARLLVKMHLMYTLDPAGKRVYTLKKVIGAEVTKSAHPARFSPDDKYSRHRVTLKKRYGLLLVQQKDLKVLGQ